MPQVFFTSHLSRHLECPSQAVDGETLRDVLHNVFQHNPQLQGYLLDDHGRLRQHVVVFIDQAVSQDRDELSDPVQPQSQIYVMQALSGG